MTNISKAAFARELGVSKARISQLITRGLPVRDDGKIDRDTALTWVKRNVLRPNRADRVNTGAQLSATALEEAASTKARDEPLDHVVSLSSLGSGVFMEAGAVLLAAGVADVRMLLDRINAEIMPAAARYADDLVLEELLPEPPGGLSSWAGHEWFMASPLSDMDWDDCVAAAAEYALKPTA
jgi:hypothetical protein